MASWLKVAEGNVTDLVSLNRLFHLILFQFINFVLDSVNFNSLEFFNLVVVLVLHVVNFDLNA
jgi:hypothetical protein